LNLQGGAVGITEMSYSCAGTLNINYIALAGPTTPPAKITNLCYSIVCAAGDDLHFLMLLGPPRLFITCTQNLTATAGTTQLHSILPDWYPAMTIVAAFKENILSESEEEEFELLQKHPTGRIDKILKKASALGLVGKANAGKDDRVMDKQITIRVNEPLNSEQIKIANAIYKGDQTCKIDQSQIPSFSDIFEMHMENKEIITYMDLKHFGNKVNFIALGERSLTLLEDYNGEQASFEKMIEYTKIDQISNPSDMQLKAIAGMRTLIRLQDNEEMHKIVSQDETVRNLAYFNIYYKEINNYETIVNEPHESRQILGDDFLDFKQIVNQGIDYIIVNFGEYPIFDIQKEIGMEIYFKGRIIFPFCKDFVYISDWFEGPNEDFIKAVCVRDFKVTFPKDIIIEKRKLIAKFKAQHID